MATKNEELSFEEQIKELELIVKNLENGNISLDESISKFNEAMNLVNSCNEKLKKAEENINKIVNTNLELEDFKVE